MSPLLSSVPYSSGSSSNCVVDCGHSTQLAYPAYYPQSWKGSALFFAAFIRGQIDSGAFWCRLIMAKCRIASANKLSTAQMELIAAVLSKRERALQLADSTAVLKMVIKTSSCFKVNDPDPQKWGGVLLGQSITTAHHSRLADPIRLYKGAEQESHWWNGPSQVRGRSEAHPTFINCWRFSNINRVIRLVARLKNIPRNKTFIAENAVHLTVQHLKRLCRDWCLAREEKFWKMELFSESILNIRSVWHRAKT